MSDIKHPLVCLSQDSSLDPVMWRKKGTGSGASEGNSEEDQRLPNIAMGVAYRKRGHDRSELSFEEE
jgi:hypothetical protein